MHAVMSFSR